MSVVVVSCFEWALCHPDVVDVVSRRFIDDALAAAFARDWTICFVSAVAALLLFSRVGIGYLLVVGGDRCVNVFGAGE